MLQLFFDRSHTQNSHSLSSRRAWRVERLLYFVWSGALRDVLVIILSSNFKLRYCSPFASFGTLWKCERAGARISHLSSISKKTRTWSRRTMPFQTRQVPPCPPALASQCTGLINFTRSHQGHQAVQVHWAGSVSSGPCQAVSGGSG